MKALTIWQPWASLIAAGEKIYETRSWPTKYRGPIAIHAAMKDPAKLPIWTPELEKYTADNEKIGPAIFLPTGCVVAIGELVNVWHIVYHPGLDVDRAKHIDVGAESMSTDKHAPDFGDYFVPTEKEMALGDWTPGRYAWEIRNVKILEIAPEVKGHQGLWDWDENAPRDPGWKYLGPGAWIKVCTDPITGKKYFMDEQEAAK